MLSPIRLVNSENATFDETLDNVARRYAETIGTREMICALVKANRFEIFLLSTVPRDKLIRSSIERVCAV